MGNGRIEKQFKTLPKDINNDTYPFGPKKSFAHQRGMPDNIKMYNENDDLLRENSFEFNVTPLHEIGGVTVGDNTEISNVLKQILTEFLMLSSDDADAIINTIKTSFLSSSDIYDKSDYTFYSDRVELERSELIVYDENYNGTDDLEIITSYTYRGDYPYLISEVSQFVDEGFENLTVKYQYPSDADHEMAKLHMHNYPFNIKQSGIVEKEEIFKYANDKYEKGMALPYITEEEVWLLQEYENKTNGTKIIYDEYDKAQNLTKYYSEGDIDIEITYDKDLLYLPILITQNRVSNLFTDKLLERNTFIQYHNTLHQPILIAEETGVDYSFDPYLNNMDLDLWNKTRIKYDGFGRKTLVMNNNGDVVEQNEYDFENNSQAQDNFISQTNIRGIENKTFLDGLLRPTLKAVTNFTNSVLLTPITYNAQNQVTESWLPMNDTSFSGDYINISNPETTAFDFYSSLADPGSEQSLSESIFYDTDLYYENIYDNSPLNRVNQQNLPGDWTSVYYSHEVNTAADNVYKWDGLYHSGNTYAPGTLYKKVNIDESGTQYINFYNYIGQLILKRIIGSEGLLTADTYYDYDNYGNLTHIISPLGSINEGATEYAHIYDYDDEQRLISKKTPGKPEPETFDYDDLDRVTRHFNGQGDIYYKYDALSRVIYTGTNPFTSTPDINDYDVLTQNVYDYFDAPLQIAEDGMNNSNSCVSKVIYKGGLTATRVKTLVPEFTVLNDDMRTYTFTAFDFDKLGRVKEECSSTFLIKSNRYSQYIYNAASDLTTEITNLIYKDQDMKQKTKSYFYDAAGRIENINIDAMGTFLFVTDNTYDPLGNMYNKTVGGIENTYYYNLRSWLTHINTVEGDCFTADVSTANGGPGEEMGTETNNSSDNCWENGKISLLNLYALSKPAFTSDEDKANFANFVYLIHNDSDQFSNENIKLDQPLNATQQETLNELQTLLNQQTNHSIIFQDDLLSYDYSFNELLPMVQELSTSNNQRTVKSIWSIDQNQSLNQHLEDIEEAQLHDNYKELYYNLDEYVQTYCEAVKEYEEKVTDKTNGEYIKPNNGIDPNNYEKPFSLKLTYNPVNGRMSSMAWRSGYDCIGRNYQLEYDGLDRLTNATYGVGTTNPDDFQTMTSGGIWHYVKGDYSMTSSYDLNGNIRKSNRNGYIYQNYIVGQNMNSFFGEVDAMAYTYKDLSNVVKSIDDSTDDPITFLDPDYPDRIDFMDYGVSMDEEYSYDDAGNMTYDSNRQIDVNYNIINLPEKITREDQYFYNFYDARGKKLRKKACVKPTSNEIISIMFVLVGYDPKGFPIYVPVYVTANGTIISDYPYLPDDIDLPIITDDPPVECYRRDYFGDFEYINDKLEAVNHEDGRIVYDLEAPDNTDSEPFPASFDYIYRDHLGNGRAYYTHNLEANETYIQQERHYYPFGMPMTGLSATFSTPKNNYSYNGKEYHNDFDLGWYDYGARWYDPQVGRWWGVDPLSAKNASDSPYNYVHNNPLLYVDPDGRDNVIYVVALKGSQKYGNINNIITEANRQFHNLGVETRAVLFEGTYNQLDGIDPNDRVAVFGEANQAADFIQKGPLEVRMLGSNDFVFGTLEEFRTTDANPELGENNDGGGGNLIVIAADRLHLGDTWMDIDKVATAGFFIVHAAGHTVGIDHCEDKHYIRFMCKGTVMSERLMANDRNGDACNNTADDLINHHLPYSTNNKVYEKWCGPEGFGTNKAYDYIQECVD